jgi:hypothetical protein
MESETFEEWAEEIKDDLDEYRELSFTKINTDGYFIYKLRLLTNPFRIEHYYNNPKTPTSTKTYISEEACFNILKEKIYPDPDLCIPDYNKSLTDGIKDFRFELTGYTPGFSMEKYSKEIDETIEHINTTHNQFGFKIIRSEVSGESFDLTVDGDYPKWQVHFIRLLVDKTDLSEYRYTKSPNTILSYSGLD